MRTKLSTALVMTILMTAFAVLPAAASTCGTMTGVAHLQVDEPSNTGVGVAVVVFAGSVQLVDFTTSAQPGGPSGTLLVTHEWDLDQGDVTLLEVNDSLTQISGTALFAFASTAAVTAGGTGSLAFRGVYDDRADVALFRLRGSICVG